MSKPKLPALQGYVIFDEETELYSKGGSVPRWHKTAKIWRRMTDLKLHLQTQFWHNWVDKQIVISPYYMRKKHLKVYDVATQEVVDLDIHQYLRENAQKKIDKSNYLRERNFTVKEA